MTRKEISVTTVGTGLVLATLAGAMVLAHGNWREALAELSGQWVTAQPADSILGDGAPGEERHFRVEVRNNHTDRAIRIIGGTSSCSCVTIDGLPLSIPPGESRVVDIRARYGRKLGPFRRRFGFLTDDSKQFVVAGGFHGRVVAVASQDDSSPSTEAH